MIAIATGMNELDVAIQEKLKTDKNIKSIIVNYREFFDKEVFNIVIVSQRLEGTMDINQLFFLLKSHNTRIIYLTNENDIKAIKKCFSYSIYDILLDPVDADDVVELINKPNTFADIQKIYLKYSNIQTDCNDETVPVKIINTGKTKVIEKIVEKPARAVEPAENGKVISVEKRIEVKKEIKVREIDKCVIAVVSSTSSGKTFISWNLEKMFSDNEYNTALISADGTAKFLYGIENNKTINLNNIKVNDNIKDFAVDLANSRTVYLNTNLEMLDEKPLEILVNKCRIAHDIIIIDSVTNNKENILKTVSLSNKVLVVFDIAEYNIEKNLRILNTIINIFNKDDIIAVINNYVDCSSYRQLEATLENMGINNAITISAVKGEDIYDLMGTSYVPADSNNKLRVELQVLLECLKAREGVKRKISIKYIRKELKVLKYAFQNYTKNKNTVRFLKIAVFLFIIVLIITFLNYIGINPFQEIKNYFGGNE